MVGGYVAVGGTNSTNAMIGDFGYGSFTPNFAADTQANLQSTASGTAFAGGPAQVTWQNPIHSIYVPDVLNNGGKSIYQEAHYYGAPVALFPYAGSFRVAYLGNDWSYSGPNGTWDGNWKETLNRTIKQVAKKTTSTAPAAPSALAATPLNTTTINLSWKDNSSNETGFEVQRASSATGTFEKIATTAAGVTSYSNKGLKQNTTYFYRVRAINASGSSAFTSVTSANGRGRI